MMAPGFGIIHRVNAPVARDPLGEPGYRTNIVNRHLRAMLCCENGFYHSPDHLNAFEVAQAVVNHPFPPHRREYDSHRQPRRIILSKSCKASRCGR